MSVWSSGGIFAGDGFPAKRCESETTGSCQPEGVQSGMSGAPLGSTAREVPSHTFPHLRQQANTCKVATVRSLCSIRSDAGERL